MHIEAFQIVELGTVQCRAGSDPTKQHQHNENDENCADKTNAAVTVAITVTAKAAAEPAEQEDNKYDDKDES